MGKQDEMMEMLEEDMLFLEAEERMKNAKPGDFLSKKQVMDDLGIDSAELDGINVDIE